MPQFWLYELIQTILLCKAYTLLKIKVLPDAIKEPFCLNGSIKKL